MISICIKSTSTSKLNILEQQLDQLPILHIYYSQKTFAHYHNLIIHYKGKNNKNFYETISNIITNFIIENYEEKIIRAQIMYDYFYFNASEKELIISSTKEKLKTAFYFNEKKFALESTLMDYICSNKAFYLEGFINFRIYKYKKLITSILEDIINDYIIQKEYTEYVNLLHEYIQSQPSQSDTVHLIYSNNLKLLLDDNEKIISNINNSQIYLSDISFSTNDFILNSLLTVLPQRLYIHINIEEDNFIKFLKLVFNGKYSLCNHCNICSTHLSINSTKSKKRN